MRDFVDGTTLDRAERRRGVLKHYGRITHRGARPRTSKNENNDNEPARHHRAPGSIDLPPTLSITSPEVTAYRVYRTGPRRGVKWSRVTRDRYTSNRGESHVYVASRRK